MRIPNIIAVFFIVLLTVRPGVVASDLSGIETEPYQVEPSWRVIKVENERQLRAALTNPALGWRDQRTIQLTDSIYLNESITLSNPVRIEGNCISNENGRCLVKAEAGDALFYATGPAALVTLANLELKFGHGSGEMGGAVTASNYSQVDIISCVLTGNSALSGGAIMIAPHAHVNVINSVVADNVALKHGGGIGVSRGGSLHLENSLVANNEAARGGGVHLNAGSILTAVQSTVQTNSLTKERKRKSAKAQRKDFLAEASVIEDGNINGADIVLEKELLGQSGAFLYSEAFFRPLPAENETFVAGGKLKDLKYFNGRLPNGDSVPFDVDFGLPADAAIDDIIPGTQSRDASSIEHDVQKSLDLGGSRKNEANILSSETSPFSRRALQQSFDIPSGARVVEATSEEDFAKAILGKERYINLTGHIILSGLQKGDKALLPSIKASLTVDGNCPQEPYGGKCLLNGQGLGAILFADNSAFTPGMEIVLKNIIFLNGQSSGGTGGALANKGAFSITFIDCDFVNNAAGSGGAVALIEGAFSIFSNCTFSDNAAATDGSGPGTGGAVLLTGSAGFTRCSFKNNVANNGGAIGVGGSSQGIFFEDCTFEDNDAEIFGNDIYMESWVITIAYFNPYPTTADVYTTPDNILPLADMPPMYYPASVPSPPPLPPAPPSPPPPAPPGPPNPKTWIYNEDQLWDALNEGNRTIVLGAHIQFGKQGRWALAPPPTIISSVEIVSKCTGYGETCIIDLSGSRFPLLDVRPGAFIKVSNVRIINGATMENGAAVQLNDPGEALFDSCDFIGNYAVNGGAITIKSSLPTRIEFENCKFGLNFADENGGAVYSVGAAVKFKDSSFYLNRAKSGGAIALGPVSTLMLINGNFTRNKATKWGTDIFLSTTVGSVVYMNQWPPETAAKIYPMQSDVKWYYAPPPVPPAPPSPALLEFKRAPYPPPGPLPPFRIKASPPSPPSPPPFPPPRPPSPPMDVLIRTTPFMWKPFFVGVVLIVAMFGLVLCAAYNRRILPTIEDPDELAARLAGEYAPPSDEDDPTISDIDSDSDGDPTGGTQLTLAALAAAPPMRRRGAVAPQVQDFPSRTGEDISSFDPQIPDELLDSIEIPGVLSTGMNRMYDPGVSGSSSHPKQQ